MVKTQKKAVTFGKKTPYKALWCVFFALVILNLTQIPSVSAFEFDNIKNFDGNVGNYGKYEVRNSVFGLEWWQLDKVLEIELKENTETCDYDECYAIKDITLYGKRRLVEDVRFYKHTSKGWTEANIRTYSFYLKTAEEQYEVDDYERQCVQKYDAKNKTNYDECSMVKIGSHFETRDLWEEFDISQEFDAGNYTIKLIGYKDPEWKVDWQIKTGNIWTDEWAVWNNDTISRYEFYEGSQDNANWIDSGGGDGNSWQTFTIGTVGTDIDQIPVNVSLNIAKPSGSASHTVNAWITPAHNSTWCNLSETDIRSRGNHTTTYTSSFVWYNISMSRVGQEYLEQGGVFCLWANSTAGNEQLFWGYDSSAPAYAGGNSGYDATSQTHDAQFQIFSTPISAQVVLNSPEDNYISQLNEVEFNCSAEVSGGATLTNISLWHNGTGTWELNQSKDIATSVTDAHSQGLSSAGTESRMAGAKIWALENITLTNVTKYSSATATNVTVMLEDETIIASATFSGDVANLNVNLNESTRYIIGLDNSESNYDAYRTASLTGTFNISDTNINWTAGYLEGEANSGEFDRMFNLISITTEETAIEGTKTFNSTITEPTLWTCQACDSDGDCGFATVNRTVDVDADAPLITINIPQEQEDYGYEGKNESLNWSIVDTNLNTVWYDYNGTNVTIVGAVNETNFTLLTAPFNLTLYTNDSVGNFNSSTIEWAYRVFENNQTYTTPVISSSTQDFNITIDYNDTLYTNILGFLIYDDVSTSATKTGSGDNTIFSATKTIPLVSGSVEKEFYWNFTLTNSTGSVFYVDTSSNSNNQTVQGITLALCDATYNVPYVNFTFEDEITGADVNGTFSTTFNYWLLESDGSDSANVSLLNATESPSYAFCVDPNYTSINVDMSAEYGGGTYVDRTYYLNNATLTNSTNNITLYQLNDSNAVKFFITVKDGIEAFTGATVTISKFFVGEGIYKTTGIRETDDAGKFIEYLDLDKDYRFAITRDGVSYGVIDKTSTCAEAPCEIDLQIEGAISNLWEGFTDYYAGNVEYSFRYNDSSKEASLVFVDTTGLAQYMRFHVFETNTKNETVYTVCNDTLYSSSGTITCDMTGESGDFTAKAYLSRSPEKFVDVWNFAINLIKDTLGLEGVLVALFLIITIALVGAWSPTAGIVLTTFAVIVMKILGFVAFSYTTVVLIFILAVIIIVKVKQ